MFHTAPSYEHTFGPEVVALCRQVGYEPDPEQALCLNDIFAVRAEPDEHGDILSAAYESAVIATRQQLKTGVGKQAVLGWLFVTQEELITWSAHLFSTTAETFRDLSNLILNSPMLRKRLAPGVSNGIHGARGSEEIELRDGRRTIFRSRTITGGRGLTGDKMVLDEALALREEHMGALTPTLTAVTDPQLLYLSSAGFARSEILRHIRNRGRSGSPRLMYAEWGSRRRPCEKRDCGHPKRSDPRWEPGCALDDEETWAEASPLLGRRRSNGTGLTLEKMRAFRESEPSSEWMRERLGWWDEDGADELFGPGLWAECAGPIPVERTIGSVGIAVSVTLGSASVALGAKGGDRVMALPSRIDVGTEWLVSEAVGLAAKHRAPLALDGGGPGAFLLPSLKAEARKAGVRVVPLSLPNWKDACAAMHRQVTSGELLHANWPELDAAVAAATRRDIGDRWAWGRRGEGDISMLEAATVALWAQDNARTRSAVDQRLAEGRPAVMSV